MSGSRFSKRLQYLKPFLLPHRYTILGGCLMVVASTALDQVPPWMIKHIIDALTAGKAMSAIYSPLLWIAGSALIGAGLLLYQRLWVIQASRQMEYAIRKQLFADLLRQPKKFFDGQSIGHIMSLGTNDLERVRELLGPAILHLGRMGFQMIFTLGCLLALSPKLALLGLLPTAVLPLAANYFLKRVYQLFGGIQKNLSSLNAFVQDTITGIHVVKAYGKESDFQERFQKSSQDLRDSSLKVAAYNSLLWPAIGSVGALGILLVLWVGSREVINGDMSVGTLSACMLYLLRLQFPLIGLGWVISLIQRANVSVDRLLELESKYIVEHTELPTALEDLKNKATQLPIKLQSVSAKNLSFSFVEGQAALKNIDLKIEAGKWLGIVGPIGSGKTTLVQLLCGIYAPSPNMLFLNGKAKEEWNNDDWKRFFSYVPQDGFLFSTTIRKNIEMGRSNLSDATVEDVGTWSAFAKDLPQISHGYEALLGERGINLSGGQRQRVGLARALLANAQLLCLDDTLSALDPETESEVLGNLRQRFSDATVVIVSHRYSSMQYCDEVIYLDKGLVTERGKHEQLIHAGGAYSKVWERQQLSQSLKEV